ncbi:MAG: IS110 family transposase [Hyphomicrobiales bacterium]|nr:IS110 family transposase [Hyphomicrobiales bacterium]MBV9517745.1 IS110 family transposase [Hyphomicrobiales bacterium]
MPQNDLSKSLVAFEQHSTLVAVVELSLKSWLIAGLVPGLERQPLKKMDADAQALLMLLQRWRGEALASGQKIERMVVAMEAGRDGFWLPRFLQAHGIEAYVIHPTSIPVSREHRRAKTDRLDTALLMRAFLGWLRGEDKHCSMVAVPSLPEEDAKRVSREHEKLGAERGRIVNQLKAAMVRLGIRNFNVKLRKSADRLGELRTPEGQPIPAHTLAELRRQFARLGLVKEQIKEIECERQRSLKQAPTLGSHPMILLLAKLKGIGLETADMLTNELFYRELRDRRAVARYGGLTGAPDESGKRRREKGLARAGNARVRKGMLQLAWRWIMFQKESALTQWYQQRTTAAKGNVRKTMIIALARKLLIALWRYVTIGELPAGVVLNPAI